MKIYDCFVFFNELKLLEFRLSMYYDYVDYFVLCECSKTQRGEDKPYYFEENKILFEKYLDKIIHVKADDPPLSKGSDDWSIEFYQREQISQGLKTAKGEDLIIISDLDEFYSSCHTSSFYAAKIVGTGDSAILKKAVYCEVERSFRQARSRGFALLASFVHKHKTCGCLMQQQRGCTGNEVSSHLSKSPFLSSKTQN